MMMDVLQILKDAGAILDGHFIGNSGRHLATYVNKDAWLPNTELVSYICRVMAELNKDNDIDVVVAPAVGGVPLSQWTAHHLSEITGKRVLSLFTEKTSENRQVLNRKYDKLVEGKRVLVVEDTVSTGASVKKTIEAVKAAGGNIIQLTLIVNRDPKNVTEKTFGVPIHALVDLPMASYGEDEVPDWLKAIPINAELGHGKEYLTSHGR